MTLRFIRLMFVVGLGVLAGAVLPRAAYAQVPVRRDTVAGKDTIKVPVPARADSMLRNDSLLKGVVPLPKPAKPDTIKPQTARSELAPVFELGAPRVYDHAAMYATGALTLGDLLERVPGITEYTTGFLAAPSLAAVAGNFRRLRVFIDGLELDPMDRRARGVSPGNDLPLQALEEVRIERGADEIRVLARTWRVNRTDPFTHADVATGDQNTNLYRAYFGQRYDHGETIQFSAEQLNTQPDSRFPSSDGLSVFGRLGLQHGPWNVDATAVRLSRNRGPWLGTGNDIDRRDTVPELSLVRTTAYLRLANGDPEAGRWFQVVASSMHNDDTKRASTDVGAIIAAVDSTPVPDSTEYESQWMVAGGVTLGPLRASLTDRLRVSSGRSANTLSGRASGLSGPVSLSLLAESASPLDPSRIEASAKLSLLGRVGFLGVASRTGAADIDRLLSEPRSGAVLTPENVHILADTIVTVDSVEVTRYHVDATNNYRAELGIRLNDLWVSGGILHRGPATLLPPAEIGIAYTTRQAWRTEGDATARLLTVKGRLWKALFADAWAVAWTDSNGFYRPQYQTRSELYIQTNLLNHFPRGNFGLLTSLTHEYRSSSLFPVDSNTARVAPGYRLLSFKIEIRVQTAVVTYQFRNLLQERYQMIPGFNLPRQTQFYGVRWDFWN